MLPASTQRSHSEGGSTYRASSHFRQLGLRSLLPAAPLYPRATQRISICSLCKRDMLTSLTCFSFLSLNARWAALFCSLRLSNLDSSYMIGIRMVRIADMVYTTCPFSPPLDFLRVGIIFLDLGSVCCDLAEGCPLISSSKSSADAFLL